MRADGSVEFFDTLGLSFDKIEAMSKESPEGGEGGVQVDVE